MTRRAWVYVDGIAYEKGDSARPETHHVMPDLKPYRSMADGTLVEGRAQHREMLRRNGCVEVGNEVKSHLSYYDRLPKDVAPQQRKELIRAQVAEMTQTQFKAAIKKDADFVKWNSRQD